VGSPVNVYGAIAFAINVGSVIFLTVLNWWFVRRLRRCDPDTYASLGSPSFWNQSSRQTLRCTRFLFSSEWRRLSDPALVIGYFALRILSCIYLILFLTILVLFLRGDFRPTKDHPRFGSGEQHRPHPRPKLDSDENETDISKKRSDVPGLGVSGQPWAPADPQPDLTRGWNIAGVSHEH
jgi:hypothetical protein